jgi:oligopeptide transport system ATP-binding protein
MAEVLLEAQGLRKSFYASGFLGRRTGGKLAVDNVSLSLMRNESLGIVGESGSGKSTVARLLTRLNEPDAGSLRIGGEDFLALRGEALRLGRRRIQMVFQDPFASLNPRKTIGQSIAAPLLVQGDLDGQTIAARVDALLAQVGLEPAERYRDRFPKDLSGGQRQRVGIARAIALNPDIVVADEAVSALDISVRAQILNLFNDLRARFGLSYVFISHDLDVIRAVCDRVIVMQAGRVVETGTASQVLDAPTHPYTRELVASSLRPDPGLYRTRPSGPALVPGAVFKEE